MIKTNASSWRMQVLIFFGFVLYTLATLLFCNRFSPLFSHLFELDPCMFYMLGRAWCAGYLPYADIIDVKGPLLIAIYALIYLTSPGNPCMVYVFNSLFTAGTIFFSYKTASLFLQSTYQAILAAALVLPCICAPWHYHGGNQSEIIMMLPVSICIYYTACFYYTNREKKRKYRSLGIAAGSCFAICFLIKYNNILFPSTLTLFMLIFSLLKRDFSIYLRHYLCYFIVSSLLLLTPFIIYLTCSKTWDDFINVYFKLNFETYSASRGGLLNSSRLIVSSILFVKHASSITLITSILALHTTIFRSSANKAPSLLFSLLIVSLYISNQGGNYYHYYYLMMCPPIIFPLIYLVLRCSPTLHFASTLLLLFVNALMTIQFSGNWLAKNSLSIFHHTPQDIKLLEQELLEHPESRIMYVDTLDIGLGLRGSSLPAVPTWCRLNGLKMTSKDLQKSLNKGVPDYVFVCEDPYRKIQGAEYIRDEILKENGYYCFASAKCPNGSNSIISAWKKSGLQEDRSELTPAAR